MENQQSHKINRYFFLGVIIVLGLFLLFSLIEFFTAFLAAVMFYVLSKRFVYWLIKRKGWRKSWAAVLVIIISFFMILLPISLLAAMLFKKVQMVGTNLQTTVINPLKNLDAQLQERFHFILLSEKNIAQAQSFITGFISSLLNQGLNLLGTITMMYFFLYFLIIHINRMEAAIIFYLPFKRSKIQLFGDELKAQTFSNAVGVPLIAVIQGFVAYISFIIAGVPEAGFWAVITGVTSILPIIGTGLVWIPISVYLLVSHQTWQGLFVFLYGLTILSSTDNVVRFLLAKKMADVHPVVTVLGVIIGIQYFGITGLVFGPLIISYFITLLRIYYTEYQKIPPVTKRKPPANTAYFNIPFLRSKAKKIL
ncbi:MAG: AI-2E family transporter [Chitinophagaceae bacterium]|nr:AI-2E family transporter [Chitinophagaceae bacterium]MDP1762786.1 AI-2E family transporter [Sediminibacterium sp.]MDP1809989.1 AI-2E family transporter [Sediminibacterium sp.]MDP3126952.1 AI-2E family transporter [Sediminibacterium sp.]